MPTLSPAIIKAIVIAGLCVLAVLAWNALTSYYINVGDVQGAARVQSDWDQKKIVDADAHAKDLERVINSEREHAKAQAKIDSDAIQEKENEKTSLNNQLIAERATTRKLRTITGKAEREPSGGSNDTAASIIGDNETCTVRLPPEIDEGFRRLQDAVIRIGSESNDAATSLSAAQAVIIQDRITCNAKEQ